MAAVPFIRVAVGMRTILAMTCSICGQLKGGTEFGRSCRGGGLPYLDRRCRKCRWSRMEANPGR